MQKAREKQRRLRRAAKPQEGIMDKETWASHNAIHLIYAGSRLYGTEREDSDWDLRGVCLMPPSALLGLGSFEQYNLHNKLEDIVIYGTTKFFALAAKCNPNILELLFAPPETWLARTDAWSVIYEARHAFLSERVRRTFTGYAYSQLKRLQGHYQWLSSPPKKRPTPEDFGGSVVPDRKGGQKLVFPSTEERDGHSVASKQWKQYQTWLRERNPARAKLEEKYGYDTKHACNLVRMLLQGEALLQHGTFNPRLPVDIRDMVLNVLHGGWPYGTLLDWATAQKEHVETMQTSLPKEADMDTVNSLLVGTNLKSLFVPNLTTL